VKAKKMKRWSARVVFFSGIYDGLLTIIFLFWSPLVSLLLNYPLSILSAALLQIIGAFLLPFGFALLVASRRLDRHLLIPIANIPARLIAFVLVIYYVLLGCPLPFSG
jgi:hypothetical protein